MEAPSSSRLKTVIIFAILGLGALFVALISSQCLFPFLMEEPHEPVARPTPVVDPRSQLPPLPGDAAPFSPNEPDAESSVAPDAETVSPVQATPSKRVSKTLENSDIVRLGPGRYQVRREAIDTALAKGGTGGARAVPVKENGAIIGYRISGITGKLQQLGLRNGDVVTAVNGRKLTSPEAAIAAYGGLRKAQRASITVRRGGRPVSLGYSIVD